MYYEERSFSLLLHNGGNVVKEKEGSVHFITNGVKKVLPIPETGFGETRIKFADGKIVACEVRTNIKLSNK